MALVYIGLYVYTVIRTHFLCADIFKPQEKNQQEIDILFLVQHRKNSPCRNYRLNVIYELLQVKERCTCKVGPHNQRTEVFFAMRRLSAVLTTRGPMWRLSMS